ncbi:MAG: GGDEF domain-containing protein [Steroidobacteraceae bacterium]
MVDSIDWQGRYKQIVREFDAAERNWRDLEQILRRMVGRLCAYSQGNDAGVDEQLTIIATASRRDADAGEFTLLLNALATAVTSTGGAPGTSGTGSQPAPIRLNAPHPPLPCTPVQGRWGASIAAVGALLRHLRASADAHTTVADLVEELQQVQSDEALARVIERVAELVGRQADRLARERSEAEGVLHKVTQRLEEISVYLVSSHNERTASHDDTDLMTTQVCMQVRSLNAEVGASTELSALKASVSIRLEAIGTQVDQYREREQRRFAAQEQATERMSMRVAELEQQTRYLQNNLDEERRRARLDSLTGVANRAAFDERFAQELARQATGGGAVSMLLWDLDHFKSINDRHGHRVGDAVLREVARCFKRQLRVEDFVARIGGEEFATLLVGAPLEVAVARAEQLRAAVAALKLHVSGVPVHVTVSCGATELRAQDRAEEIFDRADAALYRAKEAGRNVCIAA